MHKVWLNAVSKKLARLAANGQKARAIFFTAPGLFYKYLCKNKQN
jgi:hypothetical protein